MVRLKRVFARVWQPKYPVLCYHIFVDIDKCLFSKIFRLLAFTSENRVKMRLYRTPENVQL